MLINPNIIENLIIDAGTTRTEKAKKYNQLGKVNIRKVEYENHNNFEIIAKVYGSQTYNTYIEVKDGEVENISCDCPDYYNHYGVCKHTLATIFKAIETSSNLDEEIKDFDNIDEEIYDDDVIQEDEVFTRKKNNYTDFNQLVDIIYNEEMQDLEQDNYKETEGNITIEPKIIYNRYDKEMRIEFKLGNKRKYKIKNLSEFYIKMINQEYYKYGEKLEFLHKKEAFKEKDWKLLDFILKYAEVIRYTNSSANSNYRYFGKILNEGYIIIGNTAIDELFDVLKNDSVEFQFNDKLGNLTFVGGNPNLKFELIKTAKDEYKIMPNFDIFDTLFLKGKKYKYVLLDNTLYKCTEEFDHTTIKMAEIFRRIFLTEIRVKKEDFPELFSVVVPKMKDAIIIDEKIREETNQYLPEKLGVKVFLDYDDNNYIVADVVLCYGQKEFNPLNEKEEKDATFPRNLLEETKAFNMFRKSGFLLDVENNRFILPEDEKIYNFLVNDINNYMQKFEVLATDNFKTKEIIKPKIGLVGVRVDNNLLSVDLSKINIDKNEINEIMEKYKLKKKYYRLKNGAFINLEDNKELEFLDNLVKGTNKNYNDLKSDNIKLPINRTMYFNELLKELEGVDIQKNKEYDDITNGLNKNVVDEDQISNEMKNVLRGYQKTGVKWLQNLDKFKFGGILADDMGLGKTLQVITLFLDYVENVKEEKRASLVVCPSSLSLNWKNEIKKFAPNLKVSVIKGKAIERKAQIEEIDNVDVVITSYDILKRDIEIYNEKKYVFRYVIADEAQYLKNSTTQNAKTIKQIKGDTKFALTGTPIENSLAELWSIFDFIMPGYLFDYKTFKRDFETLIVKDNDIETMQKLKKLIEPFILRRTKKEVLTELPEKTVTVLNNEMEEEQKKIYLHYLVQAKEELQEEFAINGYERSQIKILSALTRLRQICCHPSLFIEDYKYKSSKLEQCIEIIEDGINSGHKILLFSTYTSMFNIIQKELKQKGINYFKLTGQTKVDERIELVDEFNNNNKIKVFLISLKAGGTGLNLTGADMVIHYDPWWNLSAENQATDRAYRIGQKNNVQVYKLITKDSIEEKIYDLQNKKAELIDNMLNTETRFINKLSKEEILSLFAAGDGSLL